MVRKNKFSKLAPNLPKRNMTLSIIALIIVIIASSLTALTFNGFITYPSSPGTPSTPQSDGSLTVTIYSLNQTVNTSKINLEYSVRPIIDVQSCTLFLNGLKNATQNSFSSETNKFSIELGNGNYNWYVQCISNSKTNTSVTSSLIVSIPVACTNSCQTKNVRTCNGNGYQVCGDYNGDGCLELSSINSCETNQICSSGNCVTTCTSADFSSTLSPSVCPSTGKQTKTWSKIGSCQGTIPATEEVSCNYVAPACVDIVYSDWSDCTQSGTQIRNVVSSSPTGCSAILLTTRSCTYIPQCTQSNWQFELSPSTCPSTGKQTKTWSKIGNCQGATPLQEEVSCDYVAPTCTSFSYSNWSACQVGNVQTRSIVSSSPTGCAGGQRVTTQSCTYVPPCVEGQVTLCDRVLNGVVTGYKNICKNGVMTGENTCQTKCNSGFNLDMDRCVMQQAVEDKTNKFDLVVKNDSALSVSENSTGKKVLEVLGNVTNQVSANTLDIQRSLVGESREYVIVKNLSLSFTQTKTIYLEKKNQTSNAVCFKDSETNNLQDILNGCTQLMCPGKIGNYSCEVENNVFSISGLHYSGVVEDTITCGDTVCSAAEDCNSCSLDCGVCTIENVASSTKTRSGGGASSGTSSNQVTQSNNVNTGNENSNINTANSNQSQNSQESSKLQEKDTSSNVKNNKDSSFVWYAIGTILLIFVLIMVGMLIKIKLRSKSESGQSEEKKDYQNIETVEQTKMTEPESEITNMISVANYEISQGNVSRARELYEKIKESYNSMPNKSSQVYQGIIELYNKLAGN